MHVRAVGLLFIGQGEAQSSQVPQARWIGEYLDTELALPQENIAPLRTDDHSVRGILARRGQRYVRHG
jgi:hypothetical protein